MQKIIVFIIVLASFVACDLSNLEPAQTKAFMKYFSAEGNTSAVDLIALSDGYLMLGNNVLGSQTSALIIKVDKNGNREWSNNWPNVKGAALALSGDSYFIVGDSINTTDPQNTKLSLIKTNFDGTEAARTSLGEAGVPYHGTSVLVTGSGDLVVCGYTHSEGTPNQIFLNGYDANLTPIWTMARKFPTTLDGNSRTSAKSIVENSNGDIAWTALINNGGSYTLEAQSAPLDSQVPGPTFNIFSDKTLIGPIGDLSSSFNNSTTIVQSFTRDSKSGIGLFIQKENNDPTSVEFHNNNANLIAGSVAIDNRNNSSDYIVLGSIDSEGNGRSDTDFYIAKVGFDGTISSTTGFQKNIGTTGSETGVAIVPADDGGYVFLGTMRNTNQVDLMVLVKVNSNGELIN